MLEYYSNECKRRGVGHDMLEDNEIPYFILRVIKDIKEVLR